MSAHAAPDDFSTATVSFPKQRDPRREREIRTGLGHLATLGGLTQANTLELAAIFEQLRTN
ncbi:MAG: hypothetical protein LLG14_20410 [Nocardiaceae bacterium]|nr:hypothetical protein [Nocardiaceae bacterium]